MVGQSDARNVTHAGFGGMNMLYTGAAHVEGLETKDNHFKGGMIEKRLRTIVLRFGIG